MSRPDATLIWRLFIPQLLESPDPFHKEDCIASRGLQNRIVRGPDGPVRDEAGNRVRGEEGAASLARNCRIRNSHGLEHDSQCAVVP